MALRMPKRPKLPDAVLEFFRQQGSVGGKKRAAHLSAKERSEQARKAVNARWEKFRKNTEK